MKSGIGIAIALGLLSVSAAQAKQMDSVKAREQQWIYREYDGSGSRRPAAVFLWWNYAQVTFHAECPEPGTLVLNYYPDETIEGDQPIKVTDMGFERRGKRLMAKATEESGPDRVAASFPINDELLALLKPDGGEMTIDAANQTGDPWFVGDAAPLYEAAQACKR